MRNIQNGNGKFYIGDKEDNPSAEITYQKDANGNLIVEHTFVSEELRGQGVAGKLVEELVQFANQNGIKIIPECSFAKMYIEKNNLQEILA
ncbi:GNAT family N-acetyltransferase [Ornithinibacillus scapharcae]|uniref:GNAT family N-acetyltransferase n=1 Tax=Ornithinibacillus scapharcae TaxID=1147159 RepID=UPI000225B6B9|nr:GNAT family N-acetyltransferase [Ornithinibacillus scapharcae]